MIKKRQNTIDRLAPLTLILLILVCWQVISFLDIVDTFILPSPLRIISTFYKDFILLAHYSLYTIFEGLTGLILSIIIGYSTAILLDRFDFFKRALYPILVVSQTVPTITIAPLLVLWLGYGIEPKIALVLLTCFFPITIGVYDGMRNIQREYIDELKVLGGSYLEGLWFVKMPLCLPSFFSALKIATTYSIVAAVVSEWIGGTTGIGVYMIRVRKSYEFDKMFAAILLIVFLSNILTNVVKFIERRLLQNV